MIVLRDHNCATGNLIFIDDLCSRKKYIKNYDTQSCLGKQQWPHMAYQTARVL